MGGSVSKILVVEDERDIVETLKIALERDGWTVTAAFDGMEALDKINEEKPDLIVLDIMLPKLDGHSLNIQLKKNPETANIPVVVMTGRGGLKDLLQLKENVNISAYLEKPFPIRLLKEKIENLLWGK